MIRIARGRWLLKLAVLLLAGLLPLAVLSLPGMRPRDWLLVHWRQQLESDRANPQRAKRWLQRIALLDEEGLKTVVELLEGDSNPVSEAALEALNESLNRWKTLAAPEASAKLACLARLLADHTQSIPVHRHRELEALAERILIWPVDRQAVDVPQVVADCAAVLRATSRAAGKRAPPSGHAANPVDLGASPETSNLPDLPMDLLLPVFPGGGLTLEAAELPYLPRAPVEITSIAPDSRLNSLKADLLSFPAPEPRTFSKAEGAAETLPIEPVTGPHSSRTGGPSLTAPGNHSSAAADLALIHSLASPNEPVVAEAEEQLRRRGYRPIYLELARRLANPDPAVRKELAETLPQLNGIDPRPWLAWLSRDPDALVRKAAIAIIATSRDAALRQQLQLAEGTEQDPDVLRLVRSALQGSWLE